MSQLQTVLDALERYQTKRQDFDTFTEAIAIVRGMMWAEPAAWIEWDLNINEGDQDSICAGATKPDLCADGWGWMPLYTHAAPQAVPAVCEWTQDTDFEMGDAYHSSCGELWSFIDGGPKENRVSYCHHCGKPVKMASAPKGAA